MRLYSYRAIDYSGRSSRGSIESPSLEAAIRELTLQGLYIVSILEGAGRLDRLRRSLVRLRVGPADILEFAQGFSVLLAAGTPMLGCLDDLIASTSQRAFLPVLRDLRHRVEHGSSLSRALEAHDPLFPGVLKTLVAVGEETGTLTQTLQEAAQHLARMQRLKEVVRKALAYPVLALSATLAALFFWVVFVIPSLAGSLKSLGLKLPALTVALIETSAFLLAHRELCLILPCLAALLLVLAGRHPKSRYLRDRFLVRCPVLKAILLNRLMVTFAEQFGMLVRGGIGIGRLFDLLLPALGNEYFHRHLVQVKEEVLSGARISDSLERQGILPPLAVSKIRIGESTGTLDNQLDYLAKWYARKLDDSIDNLGRVVEPLVMVVVGALFALIALGLLLPIYDLVSNLGKA